MQVGKQMPARARTLTLALAAALTACGSNSVEFRNREPAMELQRHSRPPGDTYLGRRVFQDRCAGCHGSDATGTGRASMGPRQFADVVLRRYEWSLPASKDAEGSKAREALLDDIVKSNEPVQTMPAWQDEPRVNAHVMDLFAYLSARAQGTLGADPPTR